MQEDRTSWDLPIWRFKDSNNIDCNIQVSSIATELCVWIGCEKADPKVLVCNEGWKPLEINESPIIFNTRMHINKEKAKKIIEKLKEIFEI